MSTKNIVIVGGGQAAGAAAMELRKLGHEGPLTIVCSEAHPPYKRPPLSKTYLAGEAELPSLYVAKPEILDKKAIAVRTGVEVTAIDRDARRLTLSDGGTLDYDGLLLATGSRARELPLPGASLDGVFPLRGIADVDAIRTRLKPGARMVIVGGGFIGLEVAAVGVKLGLQVTVLEGLDRVLARVTAPATSAFFEREHRAAGVDLRTGVQVSGFSGDGAVEAVQLADGTSVPADLVIIGVGVVPNVELAAAAGLAVDNGIVVDEGARSSDPLIVAAGDCSNFPSPFFGRRLRLESVQNAMDQAKVAAANLLGGDAVYDAVPWFWSDQYDLKLQMTGLSEGHDEAVVRGDPDARAFSVFYLRDGRIIAADTVNRPKDFMMAKKLVAERVTTDAATLADESRELKDLLPA